MSFYLHPWQQIQWQSCPRDHPQQSFPLDSLPASQDLPVCRSELQSEREGVRGREKETETETESMRERERRRERERQ